MLRTLATLCAFALTVLANRTLAAQQSCGVFSPEFTGGGLNQPPTDFAVFDTGAGLRLVAGGEFTVAGSVQARRVAQWDGSVWSELGAGFNSDVQELAVADLGAGPSLYATGRFQASGGSPCPRIARWNGASWVALGSGLNNRGWTMCEMATPAGNRLVVGGEFTTAGGQPALRVAMWDGTSWSALGSGLGSPMTSERVVALAVHDDGSGPALYAGGSFPGGIARWNGSTWSVVGGGLTGTLLSLASYDDGQGHRYLLAGGNLGSGPSSALQGWDGTSWQDLGLSNYVGGIDRMLVRQESGGPVAYLAGSFTPNVGASSNVALVARWTPSSIEALPPLLERVRALDFFDGGSGEELFAGGTFTKVTSAPTPMLQRVARLSSGDWLPLEPARHALYKIWDVPHPAGLALEPWIDPTSGASALYVGGFFDGSVDDPNVQFLARWDGATVQAVPSPAQVPIRALGQWRPSSTSAASLLASDLNRTIAFDGTSWTTLGSPSAGNVSKYVEFTPPGETEPRLYAFGTNVFPSLPQGYSCVQFDGTAWTALGNGLGGGVLDAVVWDAPGPLPRGIYAGGWLLGSGQSGARLAVWDGTSWTAVPGASFLQVHKLRVWDDGTGEALFVSTDLGLMRFDGVNWSTVAQPTFMLEPHDDGSGPALYTSDRTRIRNGVEESYGSATPTAVYPVVARHWVDQYGISQGLFFTGTFESAGGMPAIGLARYWNPCGGASSYCTAKVNSLGCTPEIGWSGEPSVSAVTPFVVTASNVINQKTGGFFFGLNGRNANPFQGGTLCVRAPFVRTAAQSSGGSVGGSDCSGLLALDFTPYLQGALGPGFNLGETVDGQWWYRDPQSSFSLGLTDAIEFQVRP
ncbi:MAG: hypothetical protein HUU28_13225 [Planctomycetaceae bacterium]|nr:hypothetical protein [Planctomycetaceae bacterium]